MRVDGRALVCVWALEQSRDGQDAHYVTRKETEGEESRVERFERELCVHNNRTPFRAQEVLVPFEGKDGARHLRYYHVFREGELRAEAERVDGLAVEEEFYENGNWGVVLRRIY